MDVVSVLVPSCFANDSAYPILHASTCRGPWWFLPIRRVAVTACPHAASKTSCRWAERLCLGLLFVVVILQLVFVFHGRRPALHIAIDHYKPAQLCIWSDFVSELCYRCPLLI